MNRSLVLLDVVGLDLEHVEMHCMPNLEALIKNGSLFKMLPIFPSVTLPVQASLTTGLLPRDHGIVSNGFFFPDRLQISFWEQSSKLVQGNRIWDRLKKRIPDFRSAVLFFQNTLFADCDALITSKPLHAENLLIPWCYSKPVGLYEELAKKLGSFNLMNYWGPLASIESSRWIAGAAVEVMEMLSPDLLMVYLPHLDYILQRFGPHHPGLSAELSEIDTEIGRIVDKAKGINPDTAFMVCSEYKFNEVNGAIPINRVLRRHKLLDVRLIQGGEYLDLELSPAIAMVDHQIAHVYCAPGRIAEVKCCLEAIEGMEVVLDGNQQREYGIDHPRSGNLVAVSCKDKWFAYPWWEGRETEPFFAKGVDIHNKPGYDPLELFLEPGTMEVSQDPARIRGSHGCPARAGKDEVPFIVSGIDPVHIPDNLSHVDLPGIIESFFD